MASDHSSEYHSPYGGQLYNCFWLYDLPVFLKSSAPPHTSPYSLIEIIHTQITKTGMASPIRTCSPLSAFTTYAFTAHLTLAPKASLFAMQQARQRYLNDSNLKIPTEVFQEDLIEPQRLYAGPNVAHRAPRLEL